MNKEQVRILLLDLNREVTAFAELEDKTLLELSEAIRLVAQVLIEGKKPKDYIVELLRFYLHNREYLQELECTETPFTSIDHLLARVNGVIKGELGVLAETEELVND
jgi:hypothetical protein